MIKQALNKLEVHGDERGKLVALESLKNIPFEIKRVYYIYDTDSDYVRGMHAHKTLEQLIIAIDGSCDFILDDGNNKKIYHINRPDVALYVGPGIWREMHNFSYGCKLLILANNYYEPNEYIRDYNEFILKYRTHLTNKE